MALPDAVVVQKSRGWCIAHRKSPAPSARARRIITACDSRESSKSICKEIALQRPKTGNLSGPNHPAHSIAFKFFTNDWSTDQARRHHSVVAGIDRPIISRAGGAAPFRHRHIPAGLSGCRNHQPCLRRRNQTPARSFLFCRLKQRRPWPDHGQAVARTLVKPR